MADVRIASAAMTRFGKLDASLLDLAAEAAEPALAGRAPDGIFVAAMAPEAFTGQGNLAVAVADRLGLSGVPAVRVETGPSSGATALHLGWAAVAVGEADRVLVLGCEKMTSLPSEEATRTVATLTHPDERAMGLSMPALGAMMARRAIHEGRCTREDMAQASVHAHAWGAKHARAHFRKAITIEDVLASPVVADPLRVLDCAPMSDGAAAVVLEREGPVRIAGLGHATDHLALAARRGPDALTSFAATKAAAAAAYRDADWRPEQIQYAEVHDAFSIVALCSVEDLGLCAPGKAGAVWRGEGVPVNRGGGLKARGHPVGATGVAQAVEAFEQLTGAAGHRQVETRRALLHSIGGLGNNVLVTLLEAA
ncbi:MAG TPA: beta-ketoacyl synthase N-terminal-like domain-containing protein [Candidatus Thermoplasmatota archaeon]|jgi:acetyl-CoA C-acetyltransferase|nr:beta-ketoacyl synthase N-terminal-like domain-containing protein [Candidatus Thermoplasmatota archaeon]